MATFYALGKYTAQGFQGSQARLCHQGRLGARDDWWGEEGQGGTGEEQIKRGGWGDQSSNSESGKDHGVLRVPTVSPDSQTILSVLPGNRLYFSWFMTWPLRILYKSSLTNIYDSISYYFFFRSKTSQHSPDCIADPRSVFCTNKYWSGTFYSFSIMMM